MEDLELGQVREPFWYIRRGRGRRGATGQEIGNGEETEFCRSGEGGGNIRAWLEDLRPPQTWRQPGGRGKI